MGHPSPPISNLFRGQWLACLLVCLSVVIYLPPALAQQSYATDQYWISLGSYRDVQYAHERIEELTPDFGQVLALHQFENGIYRVLQGPFREEYLARQALARAHRLGYPEAWVLKAYITSPQRPGAKAAEQQAALLSQTSAVVQTASPQPSATLASLSNTSAPRSESGPVTLSVEQGQPIKLPNIGGADIQVDGHLDEAVWSQIAAIDNFTIIEPDLLVPGRYPTRMRVAYSEKGLYVGVEMEQPAGTTLKRLSGRDVRDNRDSFSVTLDTSGEGRYGYWFGVNLGDALMDGTVAPERSFSNEWDGPWYGRSQTTNYGWSAEFFIPWSIVAMPVSSGVRQIGMYVSRKVAYLDERWAWPALPPTQSQFMSALQVVEMEGVQPRQQYNIYPFAATTYDWVDERPDYRVGADLFWRPSTNFQLTGTLNPDFGNVESDDVVVNLSATEVFFPEQRLFFLEGQEIFFATPRADTRGRGVGQGGPPYTMVNTRRIGGRPRAPEVAPGVDIPDRELVQPTELVGAMKATGQIGGLRYGILGAVEDEVKFDALDNGQDVNIKQDGNDYGIARLLYENRSQTGAYRAVGLLSTAVMNPLRDAVAHGIDGHFISSTGNFKVDGQVITSDIDGIDAGYGGFVDFELTYRQGLKHRIGIEYFDENIDINDLGFLARNNEYRVRSSLQWTVSDLGWARENEFDIRGFYQRSVTEELFNGGGLFLSNRLSLNNLSRVTARLSYFPRQFDDLNSFGNGTYRIEDRWVVDLGWESDTAKALSYFVDASFAEENLGAPSYAGAGGITWRPDDQFAFELSTRYVRSEGWLLHQQDDLFATFNSELWGPNLSMQYFINARQQLRLVFQWVGIRAEEDEFFQIPGRPDDLIPIAKPVGAGFQDSYDFARSRYSLQLRYRWEIAPLSDIFLVYTRQANLGLALTDEAFSDILDVAWQDPLADFLVFKIRYRFGN